MQLIVQTFLNPVFPVFAIMLLGIILGKRKVFDFGDAQTINRFVFYALVPPVIFSLIVSAPLSQLNYTIITLWALAEATLFAITAYMVRTWLKRSKLESILLGMASCFVNHVFFILPIVTVLYGDRGVLPLSVIISLDTVIFFCGMVMALEIVAHRGDSYLKVGASFLRNPVLIAMALGLTANLMGLNLHDGVKTFLSFTGSAAAPAALFSLGVIMADVKISRIDSAALVVTTMKTIVHPLFIWFLLSSTNGLDSGWTKTVLVTAAGPCGAMPFVLALQYKIKADSIGTAIIYSTVASLFTISVLA
ncbi:MAG: AEC family transporter [Desulfocapsaceae bacterium]